MDIRTIDAIIRFLLGHPFNFSHFGVPVDNGLIFTIDSDGSLGADSTLMNTNAFCNLGNVFDDSLKEFISSDKLRKSMPNLDDDTLAKVCTECEWVKLCNGGNHINRYSTKNEFSNPSVFCEALQMMYEHITKYALSNGLSLDLLKKRLKVQA